MSDSVNKSEKVWVSVFSKPMNSEFLSMTDEEKQAWTQVQNSLVQWIYHEPQDENEEDEDVKVWRTFIAEQRDLWINLYDTTIYPFAEAVRKEKWLDVEAACFHCPTTIQVPTVRYVLQGNEEVNEMECVD